MKSLEGLVAGASVMVTPIPTTGGSPRDTLED